MKKFIEVEKDFMFYTFIQWYRDNVGATNGESFMAADRYNIYNEANELIAYVYLYGETCYYIEESLYEKSIS